MQREQFEELVRDAVAALPPAFLERLANVEFEVRDKPAEEDLQRAGIQSGTLLGLYTGVPLTKRGRGYHLALPDRIIIFQRPIESQCRDEADLAQRVAQVVRHEVAHYFGISDARLLELGAY